MPFQPDPGFPMESRGPGPGAEKAFPHVKNSHHIKTPNFAQWDLPKKLIPLDRTPKKPYIPYRNANYGTPGQRHKG